MDISRHISDLLFDNDCVIVPGLGGFVCNYKPATIHPVRHFFSPPSKSILFNDKLKNNDGLLANQVAVAESLPYAEANDLIEEFVRDTLIEIGQGNKVTLENIGVFYADNEGNLQFDPDQNINFNKDSFGLTSFISPSIHREFRKVISRPEPKFANRKSPTTQTRKKKNIGRIIMMVPIVVALVWVGLNLNVGKNNHKNQTGLMPSLTENEQTSTVTNSENRFSDLISETETDPEITQKTEDKPEAAPMTSNINYTPSEKMETEVEIRKNPPDEVRVAEVPALVSEKKYFLIAGSFESLVNAEKLVTKFKSDGFQPELAGQTDNGLYRVAIAAYLRKDEALAELKKIRENYNPNVWILKK